jgi:hypothetical protein
MIKKTIKKSISLITGFVCIASLVSYSPINVSAETTPVKSEAYNWSNAKIGGTGYIPAVIFNPTEKDLIYNRTDMGGAYRWNPTTSSWIPLLDSVGFDEWNLLGCDSLATDPVDTNRVYIAAGTYTNSWTSMNGYILRSTDKGDTWQRTELPFKVGGNMPGRGMGERLTIDPNDNSILYFGARSGNGLWRSTDYGVTWAKVDSFTNGGDYVQDATNEYTADKVGVVWEAFDASSSTKGTASKTIYVGVADKANSIYCSNDSGATWQPVEGQPTGYLPHHGTLASNGMLYITYSDTCGPYDGAKGEVWKYDTKTKVWTNITPVASSDTVGDVTRSGFGGLAVDAQNPNTLMVTTINLWWPDEEIYRSLDGGATWSPIWKFDGYPNRKLGYIQDITAAPWLTFGKQANMPETAPQLGWMMDDIKIDPFNSDRMMYGTGATLYGSNNLTEWDKGGTIKIEPMANGIEESAVLALCSPSEGPQLISGLGDVNGFVHEDVTKVPDKMLLNPSFANTSIDFAELSPGFIARVGNGDTANGIKSSSFSYDGGKNWFSGNNDISGLTGGGTIAASANASVVVWSPTGASTKVSYSKDNGNSWIACSGIPAAAKVASDRVNPNKFYGFSDGKVYTSNDAGVTFNVTSSTGLPKGVGSIKAMPGHEGDLWISGGSESEGLYGIWHSTDSGASFTKLLNVEEADVIGFGKAAAGKNYMALYTSAQINGVRGIFRSDDLGDNWVRINDDEHQYGCTNSAITGDPRIYGRVYVGTNGRGIAYGDSAGTNNVVKLGDVNSDSKIDMFDSILISKYIKGTITEFPSSDGIKAADVNGDGKVNIFDYVIIKNYIAGKIVEFPAQ